MFNEADNRTMVGSQDLLDYLTNLPNGRFTTICYVSLDNIKKTTRGVDLDAFQRDLDNDQYHTNDKEKYNGTLKNYAQDGINKVKNLRFPYAGVLKMSRMTLNWQDVDRFNKAYTNYATKRDELLTGLGVEPQHKDSTTDKIDYQGGVLQGNTDNTRNNLYVRQNSANIIKNSVIRHDYLIDNNGNLVAEINPKLLKALRGKAPKLDGVGNLEKNGVAEELIQQYIKEIEDLNFKTMTISLDKILFVNATDKNGKPITIWNNEITNTLSKAGNTVNVNIEQVKEIAQKMFNIEQSPTPSNNVNQNNATPSNTEIPNYATDYFDFD